MNREDCEKLLDSYECIIVACEKGVTVDSDDGFDMSMAHDSLREVIVGIMAGEKKPIYRDGGITVRNVPLTIPPNVIDNKPIVTCDGVYRGSVPLTVKTDVANMPSIPNMNSLLREHEEE